MEETPKYNQFGDTAEDHDRRTIAERLRFQAAYMRETASMITRYDLTWQLHAQQMQGAADMCVDWADHIIAGE